VPLPGFADRERTGREPADLIEIEVRGAPSDRAAMQVARTIARLRAGEDDVCRRGPELGPHPGGGGPRRREVRSHRTPRSHLGGLLVCRRGVEHPFSERQAHLRLHCAIHVSVVVDLGAGSEACARVWTCDFTTDYVHINASLPNLGGKVTGHKRPLIGAGAY
jgi:glutamate N-acetyltransferase/amino-acid N-acetyltransferase